ncbi:hypothetical protein C8J57DRAFT_1321348, partial [Mycena rebaudengoi]
MTRSASPNGQIEFSYDFPVASTSALSAKPRSPPRHHMRLPPSPVRPQWELADDEDDVDIDDDAIDYDAFGYPAAAPRRTTTYPMPPHTKNQWRAASPPAAYNNNYYYNYNSYTPPLPASCESEVSALSSASSAHSCHVARKIRKPRRCTASVRSASPNAYLSSDDDELDFDDAPVAEEEEEEEDSEDVPPTPHAHHSLKHQWQALSLRVRFGVFRAKRRMRNRVM